MTKMLNETIECLKFLQSDGNDIDDFLSQYSEEEKLTILLNVKHYLAYSAIKNGADMSQACYDCKYRHSIPGDTHSCCSNRAALAIGDEHGVSHGWFFHPFNFDPIWLRYCDGFESDSKNNTTAV